MTGDAEHLAVGGQLDGFAAVADGAVAVFRAFGHLRQCREGADIHTLGRFEVGQRAFCRPEPEGLFGLFVALEHRFVGDVGQQVGEIAGGVRKRCGHQAHFVQVAGFGAGFFQRGAGHFGEAVAAIRVGGVGLVQACAGHDGVADAGAGLVALVFHHNHAGHRLGAFGQMRQQFFAGGLHAAANIGFALVCQCAHASNAGEFGESGFNAAAAVGFGFDAGLQCGLCIHVGRLGSRRGRVWHGVLLLSFAGGSRRG